MVNYSLLSSLKDIGCTDVQFKVVCLLVRHPRAKLTINTIAGVLDISKNGLKDAVTTLVGKGILSAQCNNYGIAVYSLSNKWAHKYMKEPDELD